MASRGIGQGGSGWGGGYSAEKLSSVVINSSALIISQ